MRMTRHAIKPTKSQSWEESQELETAFTELQTFVVVILSRGEGI
jgi:hypothetical protein